MPTFGTSFSTRPKTSLLRGACGSLSICSIESSGSDGRELVGNAEKFAGTAGGDDGPSKKYSDRRSARASGVGMLTGERNCGLLMRRNARGLKELAVVAASPVDVRGRGRSCSISIAEPLAKLGSGMVLILLKSARGWGGVLPCCCDESGLTGRTSFLGCCGVSGSEGPAAPSKPKLKPPNSCSDGRDSRSRPSSSCLGGLSGLCSGSDSISCLADFSMGSMGVVTVRLGLSGLSVLGGLSGGLDGGLAVSGGLMGSVWCLPRLP